MSLGDWIQALSLGAVAVALVISAVQLQHSSRQTGLAVRALEQGVHDLRANAVTQLSAMLLAEPEVLAWHLKARGYPEWAVGDRRTMFALLRLQIHEQTHLDTLGRQRDMETQAAWSEALRRDLTDPFYRRLWPSARGMYAPSFAATVDELIARIVETSTGPDGIA